MKWIEQSEIRPPEGEQAAFPFRGQSLYMYPIQLTLPRPLWGMGDVFAIPYVKGHNKLNQAN